MNAPGSIGRARRVAAPTSREITAALNLIATLGGSNEKANALLSDLRAAVSHNERLLAEIDDKLKVLPEIERRERELAEQEARITAKLEKADRILAAIDAE